MKEPTQLCRITALCAIKTSETEGCVTLVAASLRAAPSDPRLLAVTPLCSTLTGYISPGLCDQQCPAEVLVVILRLGHESI